MAPEKEAVQFTSQAAERLPIGEFSILIVTSCRHRQEAVRKADSKFPLENKPAADTFELRYTSFTVVQTD